MSNSTAVAQEERQYQNGASGLKNQKTRRIILDILTHLFLAAMGIIWILPIVWVFLESFNADQGATQNTFFPTKYTVNNYVKLFTETDVMNFPRMFLNTFIIAVFVCLISMFFVLSVAFCMSRLRFHFRKAFMFPGIMAVVAIYFILKAMGLTSSSGTLIALIIVYSAGSGAGFYVMKGYMDTIPASLDEAAYLDGCTKWQVFWKIIVPICKPMIVYQAIVGFLAPWLDFVMAGVIARDQHGWTVALGLWNMLQKEYIYQWYTRFAAGAVCVSVPIAILFILMQRFYQEAMSGSVKG